MDSELEDAAIPFAVAQVRRAARRTLAVHAADANELARFLDMLDLQDLGKQNLSQDTGLQAFNIPL